MDRFEKRKNGLYYKAWSFRLAQGEHTAYDTFSGKLSNRQNYKDGKKHGLWESYSVSNQGASITSDVLYKGEYIDGVKQGFWEERERNLFGNLARGKYVNGVREGLWEFYNSGTGYNEKNEHRLIDRLSEKITFANGKKHGLYQKYNFHGKTLTESGHYVNEKKDGEWVVYNPDPQEDHEWAKYVTTYKNDLRKGPFKKTTKVGTILEKGFYDEEFQNQGKKVGDWELNYALNGKSWDKAKFNSDGKREDGPLVTYHINGKVKSRGSYKNGEKEGLWEVFFKKGNPCFIGSMSRGKKVGPWVYYFKNGNRWCEYNYDQEGVLQGISTIYFKSGELASRDNFKDGERHGLCENFNKDGRVCETLEYQNGEVVKRNRVLEKLDYLYEKIGKKYYPIEPDW